MKKQALLSLLLTITLISCNNDEFVFEGFQEIKTNDILQVFNESDLVGKFNYTTTKYTKDSAYFELNEDHTFILHLQGASTGNWEFNEDKTRINISNLDLCSFIENNIDGNNDLIPTYVDFDLTYGLISLNIDSFKYVFKPRKLQVLYGAYKFYYSTEDYTYTVDRDLNEYIQLSENGIASLYLASLKEDSLTEYEIKVSEGTWSINSNKVVINYDQKTIEYEIASNKSLVYQAEEDCQYILIKE